MARRICRREGPGYCGHKSEPRNMGRGARQHTLLELNRGKGTNHLSCRIFSVAHGNVLCIAKSLVLCASRRWTRLEHVIVINLAMKFQEINRSGGSQGFVAGRSKLHLYSSAVQASVLVPTCDGDSEYLSVAYSTSVNSAKLDELNFFLAIGILTVSGAFGALALFGVPNARNYRCHSTMGILQERTIS